MLLNLRDCVFLQGVFADREGDSDASDQDSQDLMLVEPNKDN